MVKGTLNGDNGDGGAAISESPTRRNRKSGGSLHSSNHSSNHNNNNAWWSSKKKPRFMYWLAAFAVTFYIVTTISLHNPLGASDQGSMGYEDAPPFVPSFSSQKEKDDETRALGQEEKEKKPPKKSLLEQQAEKLTQKAVSEPIKIHQKHEEKHDSVQSQEDETPQRFTTTLLSSKSKYCYMFLLGGIHENKAAYEGFLYSILVSVSILRRLGSQADFVVWTQLASDSALDSKDLPPKAKRALDRMNIHHKYLPKPQDDSFAQVVYEKFRALSMTEYKRVMFLDCDLMPLVNLDYIFELTENGVLRPNMIFATRGEPANAGWFVLEPLPGEFDRLNQILEQKSKEGAAMPYPHFDWKNGFGHHFQKAGDVWEAVEKNGTGWRFHAGWSDQGLLYYWTKYYLQDVSCIIGNKVHNHVPNDYYDPKTIQQNNTSIPKIQSTNWFLLDKYTPTPIAKPRGCNDPMSCLVPYNNWKHFSGNSKPWQKDYNAMQRDWAGKVWFDELSEINTQHELGLDVRHLAREESPLGYVAKFWDNGKYLLKDNKTATEHMQKRDGTAAEPVADAADAAVVATSDGDTFGIDKEHHKRIDMVVAYAVSFIKCGDFQTHSAGLTDASLVLRHSIHKISSRNPASGSKYDYKMYAIVHRQAEECSEVLRSTGFEVLIVDPPVKQEDIQGEHLRKNIHKEWVRSCMDLRWSFGCILIAQPCRLPVVLLLLLFSFASFSLFPIHPSPVLRLG